MLPPPGNFPAAPGGDGILAPGCPVRALGLARIRGRGLVTVSIYNHACVYATPPCLYAIRAAGHHRGAIMGLFAGYAEWLAHLWPLPPGRRHRWDAERAAEDLLAACPRCITPSAEVVPFRPPPPPGGRL